MASVDDKNESEIGFQMARMIDIEDFAILGLCKIM